jgi:hypothetical protein
VFSFATQTISAQSKLSGSLYTGLVVPFSDLSETSYPGYQTNFGVGIGLGYNLNEKFQLRGDAMFGSINGSVSDLYYRGKVFDAGLTARYDVVKLLQPSSKFSVRPALGAGLTFYNSTLFEISTGDKLAVSPNEGQGFSPNPFMAAGINFGYALSKNLSLDLGYNQRYLLGQDYLDAFTSGGFDDQYGMLSVGLSFSLKPTQKPGTVEIDKSRFNNMKSRMDSLEQEANQGGRLKVARLEMKAQEQKLAIARLETEVDSLRAMANTAAVSTDNSSPSNQINANAEAILGTPMYRIVVVSMPSQSRAQAWIDRSNLDKSEMVVAYVEDVNTFRVVYKSFETVAAAKKELQSVKSSIPDAWIVKF